MTVAATGDFLIHSPVWSRALAYGGGRRYEFRPMLRAIRPVVARADLALCHMETPFSYGPPRGYPSFRTPVGLAAAIRATGWDVCSTASNHTLDAGQAGVNTTLDILDRFGVRHAGSYGARRRPGGPPSCRQRGEGGLPGVYGADQRAAGAAPVGGPHGSPPAGSCGTPGALGGQAPTR